MKKQIIKQKEAESILSYVKELLKNTKNYHLKKELEYFIADYQECNDDTKFENMLKVIQKIYSDGYDIAGFGLYEIPHSLVYCFANNETNQFFQVFLERFNHSENEVTIGYTAATELGFCTFDAKSIQEAIEKHELQ